MHGYSSDADQILCRWLLRMFLIPSISLLIFLLDRTRHLSLEGLVNEPSRFNFNCKVFHFTSPSCFMAFMYHHLSAVQYSCMCHHFSKIDLFENIKQQTILHIFMKKYSKFKIFFFCKNQRNKMLHVHKNLLVLQESCTYHIFHSLVFQLSCKLKKMYMKLHCTKSAVWGQPKFPQEKKK